jgi:outer membrane protein assembly factor BamB
VRRAARLCAAVAALLLLPSLAAARTAPADNSWLAFGHDPQITNYVDARVWTTAAGRKLATAWTAELDGGIVASPLVAQIAGGVPAVFVATEGGEVAALSVADGSLLWKRSLGSVDTGGCGTWGVTSTGAVDIARGLLYVANADGYVHALSLATGDEAPGWPLQVTDRPTTEYVWGGLRILHDTLYVPFASYCDEPDANGVPAEGRLDAIDLADPSAPPAVFDPAPGPDDLAGVWGWGGVTVAPGGLSIYTGVGNSASGSEIDGYGESLVQLTPDLGMVLGSSRPFVPTEPVDTDIGASPVIFKVPGCPTFAALNSKSGSLYVWWAAAIGAGPVAAIPLSDGVSAFVGEPSYSPRTRMLYDAGATFIRGGVTVGAGVIALRVTAACRFVPAWTRVLGRGSQPPPLVAGDVVFAAGGEPGDFAALDARTGAVLQKVSTGGATTWAPAIEARGTIFAGDLNGKLYAFRPH